MLSSKKVTLLWNDLEKYIKQNYDEKVVRRLSDMPESFLDMDAVKKALKKNPLLYVVLAKKENDMSFAITTFRPGKIGKEFYMTKGHFHVKPSPELCITLKGKAMLLMQNRKGNFKKIEMKKNVVYFIPKNWAHRTVNIGVSDAEFIAIYPTDAGHDYGSIKERGFKQRILEKYIIGVDVGGNYIKAILMTMNGKIKKKIRIKTGKGRKIILNNIIKSINYVSTDKKDLLGIGIGTPGIMEKYRITKLVNIPELNNPQLQKTIRKRFGLPVRIDNDATCLALGEYLFGAGKHVRNLVCLTLGTGIGGGIIIDSKLYHGKGEASEIGHMTIEPKGHRCSCGNYGCLEEYVSIRAAKRLIKKSRLKAEPEDIAQLAKKGNKKAIAIFNELGKYLGIGLANIIMTLDPNLILLSGGLAKSRNLILVPAKKEISKRVYFNPSNIKFAKLGDYGGATGAACLFLKEE